ncbi:MAG: bifunctional diguanylate cyclase/phosphodiesterase [Actinobacteria bacterium]|nr:bifunctional diguanylate cyclase/phosphodiesterase [Actinomycetota bacterium]
MVRGARRAVVRRRARMAKVLRWLLPLSWIGFAATVLLRPEPTYDARFDVGAYNVVFLLTALACWCHVPRTHLDGVAWRTLGAGMVLYTLGNVYGSAVVGASDSYPSPADALWLSYYVCAYVAIVLLVRSRMPAYSRNAWLDGLVGGCGAAALSAEFVFAQVMADTEGRTAVVVTNLAYPVLQLLLIVLLVTTGHVLRTRSWSWWLLTAGIAVALVGDMVFLYREAAGTYVEGGLLDLTWPLGAVLMGWAALVRPGGDEAAEARTDALALPAIATLAALGMLVYRQASELNPVALVLALLTVGLGFLRFTLTLRQVRLLAESRREARTDDLTGLANRRLILEQLAAGFASGDGAVGLIVMDLDRFKEINDSLGHSAGDELLVAVGARLEPVMPDGAGFGRTGGDEFAVVLRAGTPWRALAVARRISEALRDPFVVAGVSTVVEASVGIACSPQHGTDVESILSCADIAMYRAKRSRTGVQVFEPDPADPSRRRVRLLSDLRTALDREDLALHFQPKVDLRSGSVAGVEALLRWDHPRHGPIPPDEFIGLAEQTNLMPDLTRFVLRRALLAATGLDRAGFPLTMSVNLSSSDLMDAGFPARVDRLLGEHDLPPERLVVEVTENSVMADRTRALGVLRELRDLGVRVSVDDYGTGHASLAYLRELPVDELKLDRSFLQGVPDDIHNAAIVRSTVELAHALDLSIVAEGVEDAACQAWLRQLGCDVGQGFHISHPMPFEDLLAWLRTEPADPPAPAGLDDPARPSLVSPPT